MKQSEEKLINHEGALCLVTALMAEAKPLIDHYRLVKVKDHSAFPTFSDKDGRVLLIVSGIGKVLSAAASSSLYHISNESVGMAWLNVGIAGHRDCDLGELRWVNKIEDAASGKSWYPPRILKTGARRGSALMTVDQPGDYPEGDTLVDMEASGFYPIASRFSTRELVQCVKVVSDNADKSWRDLKKGQVSEWIKQQMNEIAGGVEELLALSADEMKRCSLPIGYDDMLLAWHFTETEKHILRKLLSRRQVLMPDTDLPELYCRREAVQSGAAVLRLLRDSIEKVGDEIIVRG
ncbi:MAG: hypothetical protein GXP30_06655 [Verrucomicrobia bacterium]|nr:hypothetical protein [Verrucomicrobiota bacterium]